MGSALISVIMSVYNNYQFLHESIDSIIKQTVVDFEFLIVDDCSTDKRIIEVLHKYAKRDNRVKVFSRSRNVGLTKNLNFLLNKSRGKYIARMDADDISRNDRFKKQLEYISKRKLDILSSNCEYIDEFGKIICVRKAYSLEYILKSLQKRKMNLLIHPSVMFNKESVMKLGGYNEAYRTGQDGDLWLRMLDYGFKVDIINEPLLKYRISNNNITVSRLKNKDINYRIAQICSDNGKYGLALNYVGKTKSFRLIALIFLRFIKINILMKNLGLSRHYDKIHKFE